MNKQYYEIYYFNFLFFHIEDVRSTQSIHSELPPLGHNSVPDDQ